MTDAGEPRPIVVLTTGRQDWGILRSVAIGLRDEPGVELRLVVGGTHRSPAHGHTLDLVRGDGFEPSALLDWPAGPDVPAADAQAAATLASFGAYMRSSRPAAVVLAGDRFETAAAALAATVDGVPIVHLHGGEQTLGAFDDLLRHAITKLAHLHLVSSDEHARRVVALGEDPATVHVIGWPGLDNLSRGDLPDRAALSASLGIALRPPVVVVTAHPTTHAMDPAATARAVIVAMDEVDATYVITLPNADPGARALENALRAAAERPRRVAVSALGERDYWGLLRVADAVVGNSSSGVIEAPAIPVPVVNVGERQAGRARSGVVIDVPDEARAVADALRGALDPAYRASLPAMGAGLLDGGAGRRAAHIIARWRPPTPPRKAPVRVDP